MGTCCSSSGTSSGAPLFGDLGAQAPAFWLPGDSQGMAGGGEDGVQRERTPVPWGLCRLGRVRPLADLGLMTCMVSESGCQMKRSTAVLTAVLHSGGPIFTGASVAIAS